MTCGTTSTAGSASDRLERERAARRAGSDDVFGSALERARMFRRLGANSGAETQIAPSGVLVRLRVVLGLPVDDELWSVMKSGIIARSITSGSIPLARRAARVATPVTKQISRSGDDKSNHHTSAPANQITDCHKEGSWRLSVPSFASRSHRGARQCARWSHLIGNRP